MSAAQRDPLEPGQFFGDVRRAVRAADLVLSDVVHSRPRRTPEHVHLFANYTLLLAGDYHEACGRRDFTYGRSTVMYHPAGIEHWDEFGSRGGRLFLVELSPAWLGRLDRLDLDGTARRALAAPQLLTGGPVHSLGLRLYRELYAADACSLLVMEGLLLEMLGETARRRIRREEPPPAWLGRALECLREELAQPWTLAALAREIGVEASELSSAFRRHQGESVGEHLRRLRVAFVCERLTAEPEAGLAGLAAEAGFADQSHLTRVFRRLAGTTPGAFQAALRRRPRERPAGAAGAPPRRRG